MRSSLRSCVGTDENGEGVNKISTTVKKLLINIQVNIMLAGFGVVESDLHFVGQALVRVT